MDINSHATSNVLSALRALLPTRPIRLHEALVITERQADRLLRLRRADTAPVPDSVVSQLPRIRLQLDAALPAQAASGASYWDDTRRTWVLSINPSEPRTRQRFTVFHEYKHIVDHGHAGLTGALPRTVYGLEPVEYLADYFAGCVLMPKRTFKCAFYDGIQSPADLAELFDVSEPAASVRLQQLGLADTTFRSPYARRSRTPLRRPRRGYQRPARPIALALEMRQPR